MATVLVVALVARGAQALSARFPLNDGGLFATMAGDMANHGFGLPATTTYNGGGIPFVYPPMALYLTGWLSSTFQLALPDLLRWIPLIAATLTAAVVVLIAMELLPGSRAPLIAGLAYALTPRAFDWLVMGGGITRSIGMLLALVATWQWLVAVRTGSWRAAVITGVAMGLAGLTHPQAALFGAASIGLVAAFRIRTRASVGRLAVAGAIGLVVLVPWLAALVANGNLGHLVGGSGLGAQPLTGLVWLLGLNWTDAPTFDVITALGLVGVVVAIATGEWLLPAWLAVVFLVDARGGATGGTAPLAMLVAVGVERGLWPILKPRPRTALGLGAVGLMLAVIGATMIRLEGFLPIPVVSSDSRAVMSWASTNLPGSARVLVVTDAPWWGDAPSEWFPALAKRVSVGTVQGSEWLGADAFNAAEANHSRLEACASGGPSCALGWLRTTGASAGYLFVPADCCPGFRSLALADSRLTLLHAAGDAVLFELARRS